MGGLYLYIKVAGANAMQSINVTVCSAACPVDFLQTHSSTIACILPPNNAGTCRVSLTINGIFVNCPPSLCSVNYSASNVPLLLTMSPLINVISATQYFYANPLVAGNDSSFTQIFIGGN